MKRLVLIAVFLLSGITAFAQNDVKPTFEKEGDLIKATYYHDNGAVAQTGFYNLQGKLEGVWKSYDENGKKVAVGNYENGKKVGKWFFWKSNSLSEVDYVNSTIKDVNVWQRSTTVVSNK
jgi:antitoxin component YwqK of YwqJK toxin-antitoxin module